MPNDLNHRGQGIIEYLLVLVLVVIIVWILYRLLGPAIIEWIRGFLNNV